MNLPPRDLNLERLSAIATPDVLIIGGGINGAGLLRDLALQGVSAVLVEKNDFASGATAASSRMIHGGLRYLENGELGLVRESLRERNRLLRNAPHAVAPLPTTIPIFRLFSGLIAGGLTLLGVKARPAQRGALLIKVGLTLYDLLTQGDRVLPPHSFAGRGGALRKRPRLNPKIRCTATYSDAQVALPERLCLELIDDALEASDQCLALNYVAAGGVEDGGVVLVDQVGDGRWTIKPRVVVNATGAWIDLANASLGAPTRMLGATKGSHLVVDHPELFAATAGEQLYYENAEGRVCIFFPLHGKVLVGSTDIRTDSPDAAVCEPEEIAYMLQSVRTVFPDIAIDESHVVSRFCGVRPLPASSAGRTGQISRNHSLQVLSPSPERPWPTYAMIGGKWTTFRSFAAEACDQVLSDLGMTRRRSTETLAIGGRTPWAGSLADEDVKRLALTEGVVHLDDLVLRRTIMGLFLRLRGPDLEKLADLCGEALGWSDQRRDHELARCRTILAQKHGVAA